MCLVNEIQLFPVNVLWPVRIVFFFFFFFYANTISFFDSPNEINTSLFFTVNLYLLPRRTPNNGFTCQYYLYGKRNYKNRNYVTP